MNRTARLAQDHVIDPVLFYAPGDEWGEFSNFSRHSVIMPHPFTGRLVRYGTTEHRFQAMKAINDRQHEWIRLAGSAFEAKMRGRACDMRPDWGDTQGSICWYVMLEALIAKASQHEPMKERLLLTGDRHIYEDAPFDDIWGWRKGTSYHGRNLLGLGLMQVRSIMFCREL